MEKLIQTIEKNSREEIRIQLREYKGHQLFDVRIFYFTDKEPEPKPSPKGISMSIRLLPQLKEAILEAEQVLKEAGVMSADGQIVAEDKPEGGEQKKDAE